MTRHTKDHTFMLMAIALARRSTCPRRRVGCVLIDKDGHIIGSGFNGVAAGLDHCIDKPCRGAEYSSGEGLDLCEAIHAEANSLLRCHDVREIDTCYVTTAPCIHCAKLLLNTGCKTIVYNERYVRSDGIELFEKALRKTRKICLV